MRLFIATVLIAFAGVVAGCGGESSGGDSTEDSQGATTGAATVTDGAVAVSGPCQAAMAVYHEKLLKDEADPSSNLDEGPLQVATLTACRSKAEWLAGVEPYSEGDGCIACVELEKVYAAMCGGSDRENLPACRS
jgi:hypothetical protein